MDGPIVESQVNSIIDVIRHRRLTLVGIVATDERDVLFLAKMVKRDVPDVQLFWIGANLIYLHSDYAPYTRGALVASTYPLYIADQRPQNEPGQAGATRRREAFQSAAAQGVFNATLVQLGEEDKLIDYCTGGDDGGRACAPPMWVSVIGDDGFWPLTHESFEGFKPWTRQQDPFNRSRKAQFDPSPLYAADHAANPSPSLPLPTPTRVLAIAIVAFVAIHLWVAVRLGRTRGSQADRVLSCWSLMRVFARPVTYPSAAGAHALARGLCFVLLCCLLAWPLGLL